MSGKVRKSSNFETKLKRAKNKQIKKWELKGKMIRFDCLNQITIIKCC